MKKKTIPVPRREGAKRPGPPSSRRPPRESELEIQVRETRRKFIAEVTARMERRGVTRSELAGRLGVSRGFVTQLLTGTSNLTLRTMVAVCRALECELEIDLRRLRLTLPPGLKLELAPTIAKPKEPAK